MIWLKGTSSQFQVWPVKQVNFSDLRGLANSASEFGLEDSCSFTCTILSGREKSDQFMRECESVGEVPDENYGFVMVSSDRREAHITLTVPDDRFDDFYDDLRGLQPAEVELEFSITRLEQRNRTVLRGLVSSDFRLKMRKADQK